MPTINEDGSIDAPKHHPKPSAPPIDPEPIVPAEDEGTGPGSSQDPPPQV